MTEDRFRSGDLVTVTQGAEEHPGIAVRQTVAGPLKARIIEPGPDADGEIQVRFGDGSVAWVYASDVQPATAPSAGTVAVSVSVDVGALRTSLASALRALADDLEKEVPAP